MKQLKKVLGIFFVLTAAVSLLTMSSYAAESKFKKMNKDGSANIVFSDTNIKKGEEAKSTLKTKFDDSESIYARAYFPAKFGQLKGEEEGFIDIWVDGKHAKRLNFSNKDVPADRDQMLIYVYNTKDYKPDFKDDVWDSLSAGEHTIKLVVGKTKFLREGVSVQDQGDRYAFKRDDVHKAVYLSDSNFTFVKN
jgi:hypothetical protein